MDSKDIIKCIHRGLAYSGRSETPNDEVLLGELEKWQHWGKQVSRSKGEKNPDGSYGRLTEGSVVGICVLSCNVSYLDPCSLFLQYCHTVVTPNKPDCC